MDEQRPAKHPDGKQKYPHSITGPLGTLYPHGWGGLDNAIRFRVPDYGNT